MIKINLAKKKKSASGSGGVSLLKNFDFSNLLTTMKGGGQSSDKKFDFNGPVPKIALALAACWFADDTLTGYRNDEIKKIDNQVAIVEKEKAAVQAKLNKIKGFEPIKKQLEGDEQSIRTKLDTVNKLLEDRNDPAKMLMNIAQAIPEEVWLTELKVNDKSVKLAGATPGYNQVSDFIKALTSTSQFTDIGLSGIQESTSASKDQRFQTFELNALRRLTN